MSVLPLDLTATARPVPEPDWIVARRGALAVATNPREILRHGVPLRLSPTEAALLDILIRKGRASSADMATTIDAAGSSPAFVDVMVHRIRRKFAASGAPDPIETLRGWGLRLRVEPDRCGSTGLWIGGPVHRFSSFRV